MKKSNYLAMVFAAAAAIAGSTTTTADSADARCDFYAKGSDHANKTVACTFSQRQGWITLIAEEVSYELEPVGDDPGNYRDKAGRPVYRQSGLGDRGQIFRFEDKSIYVYWDTSALDRTTADEDNPAAPFTTADYDATTLLRCRAAGEAVFSSCPAGILRMDDGQASIVVQNQAGEQFTINFMRDYVNATNREVEATLNGDTWTVTVVNGGVYEVPLAAIEGG
jgi:hypothetical protein